MAVNKNFVVKNGLEVNTDLILADVDTSRVGIGTSIADYTLHVNGGIGATNLNVSGVATVTSLTVSNDISVTGFDAERINITGIGTIANAELTNITGTAATIGSVQIASGIVTASTASGIVTYYGDGQYLRNIQSGVGLRTEGAVIGYGATFLDFRGAGVSTITAPVSGISTLFITGGGGGGSISISTTPPASPGAGDLWYSPDHARTFIYYDESEVGYGTSKQWIDASPFNVGVLTGHSLSVANLTVSNSANISGILTIGTLNVTNVSATGVVTASSFVGDGSGLTGVASTDNIITGTAATFNNDVNLNGYVSVGATMDFGDNDRLRFGTGNDLQIYHDGTNSVIDNNTGDLNITTTGSGDDIYLDAADDIYLRVAGTESGVSIIGDGAVELYYDNSKKLETTPGGINVTGHVETDTLNVSGISTFVGNVNLNANLDLQDDDKILLGNGDDFQIYHDGSNSYIDDGSGTGNLIFKSNIYSFRNAADSEQIATFTENAAVELYYDNSKKLETVTGGVTVTGTLTATALAGDGSAITNLPVTGVSVGKVFFLGAR